MTLEDRLRKIFLKITLMYDDIIILPGLTGMMVKLALGIAEPCIAPCGGWVLGTAVDTVVAAVADVVTAEGPVTTPVTLPPKLAPLRPDLVPLPLVPELTLLPAVGIPLLPPVGLPPLPDPSSSAVD